MSDAQPVRLPRSILRSEPTPAPPPPRLESTYTIARRTRNELILFDAANAESWIVYPPRSEYEFLKFRRRSVGSTIVEHHPWTAAVAPVDHVVDARDGCLLHGMQCEAQKAISTAVRLGYDPFT